MRVAEFILAGALSLIAGPAAAQAPLPTDFPWRAHRAAVRAELARIGLQERVSAAAPPADTSLVFTATRGTLAVEVRTRFDRSGGLTHAFFIAEGDSASVQREIDRTVASSSSRFGAPHAEGGSRVWILPDGRRFAIPVAPWRLAGASFGFAVVYHRD